MLYLLLYLVLSFSPQLPAVDDVLPQDVGGRPDGSDGVEVNVGHPDRQDGVFLPQSLTRRNGVSVMTSQPSSQQELSDAHRQRDSRDDPFFPIGGAALLYQEGNRHSGDDGQGNRPQVKRDFAAPDHPCVHAGNEILQTPCAQQRQDQQRENFLANVPDRLPERQFPVGADEGEENRRRYGNPDVAENHVAGQERDASTEHAGDDGRRRCRRRQDANEGSLRHHGIEQCEQAVNDDAADQLNEKKPDVEGAELYASGRNVAKGKKQHAEKQPRHQESGFDQPRIEQQAEEHGDGKRPVFQGLQHDVLMIRFRENG